ncbi:MAG: PorP/SprF family type IX secretion system membrane protein [Capnocytophaga sp.]|nr:PorP/SprF family type IX secretion system membrane protein [Capnocytophaga sp.]
MKNSLYIFLISALPWIVFAQQTPMYSEYNYNTFVINPAYAGLATDAELTASHNGMMGEFDGSPQSTNLSAVIPFEYRQFGLGVGFTNDKIGVTTNNMVQAAYAYRLDLTNYERRPQWALYRPNAISFGISAGFRFFRDDLLDLGITDDPRFAKNVQSVIPMVGVGIVYNHSHFFAGLSTPNIIGDLLADNPDDLNISTPYYAYFGYRFFADRFENSVLKPNILIKHEKGSPLQADFNIAYQYQNFFEVGAGYKTVSAGSLFLGVHILQNFRFVYNYTYGFGNYVLKNQHGFVLSYRFGNGYGM